MHQRIVETVEPGMRKCDLVAEIYDAGTRGVDGLGGEAPTFLMLRRPPIGGRLEARSYAIPKRTS